MTRQTKTPRQRAEEALAVAERHVKRLATKGTALRKELEAIDTEYDQAVARRDYLTQHPDLQHQPPTSTGATA